MFNERISDNIYHIYLKIIYCLKKWSGWSCCSFLLEPIDGIKYAKTKRLLKDQNYFNEMNVSYEEEYDNYTTFGKRIFFELWQLIWEPVDSALMQKLFADTLIVTHDLRCLFYI